MPVPRASSLPSKPCQPPPSLWPLDLTCGHSSCPPEVWLSPKTHGPLFPNNARGTDVGLFSGMADLDRFHRHVVAVLPCHRIMLRTTPTAQHVRQRPTIWAMVRVRLVTTENEWTWALLHALASEDVPMPLPQVSNVDVCAGHHSTEFRGKEKGEDQV